jgi:hypothetical protein
MNMAVVHWVVRAVLVVWLFRIVWGLVKAMLEELK